jgi:hypothetical protein
MNCSVTGLRVASAIFGLMGLVHLVRIILNVALEVGGQPIGRRWSAVAVLLLAVLCIWLWKLASAATQLKSETPPPAAA